MMTITFPTALWFWLTYDNVVPLTSVSNTSVLRQRVPFQKDLIFSSVQNFDMEPPLHIMVPSPTLRNRGKDFISHVMPKNLPPGSYVRLSDAVQIISPELCFLLAAKHLTIRQLTVLACDLCAVYAKNEWSEFGQINRNPVTSAKDIQNYLKKVKGVDGIAKAKTAASYALDRSNSPMESKLAVTAVLRYLYGGFSFDLPELNYNIDLPEKEAALMGVNHLCCDLVWPDKKVIVEYDSDLAHFNKRQFYFDKNRTSALVLSGYKVINVTKDSFRNVNTVENLFLLIQKALKKRINKQCFDNAYSVRRELIKEFFLTTHSLDWMTMFREPTDTCPELP